MGAVRTGLLVLYLVGTYVLGGYLRDRAPGSGAASAAPGGEFLRTLFWIWGPTLWMFPGVLWIGLLDLPLLHETVSQGQILELDVYVAHFFLHRNKIYLL